MRKDSINEPWTYPLLTQLQSDSRYEINQNAGGLPYWETSRLWRPCDRCVKERFWEINLYMTLGGVTFVYQLQRCTPRALCTYMRGYGVALSVTSARYVFEKRALRGVSLGGLDWPTRVSRSSSDNKYPLILSELYIFLWWTVTIAFRFCRHSLYADTKKSYRNEGSAPIVVTISTLLQSSDATSRIHLLYCKEPTSDLYDTNSRCEITNRNTVARTYIGLHFANWRIDSLHRDV